LGRRRLAEAQLVQLDGRAKQWARALTEEVGGGRGGGRYMPLDRKGSLEPEIVKNWACMRAVLSIEQACLLKKKHAFVREFSMHDLKAFLFGVHLFNNIYLHIRWLVSGSS
jgi:hypothetical protein